MSSNSPASEAVILLRQLSKKYPIYDKPGWKLAELLTFRKKQFHKEFWALKDIDLEVEKGATLGIIGPNGSGKSTLLQIIAGILMQTRGDCHIKGKVAALLELGAGFNPEFTGRENVYMSGAISGLTEDEIESKFDDIVAFAEIGDFIDRPVKTYSSGMFVRLAFALAIHVDPDILLVDEALAVGDMIFQHRCINRIRRLKREGKTILFVTHDLQALAQFCDRAVLLDGGRKLADGSPDEVIQRYHSLIFEREQKYAGKDEAWVPLEEDQALPRVGTIPYIHDRFGEGRAKIMGIILLTPEGRVVNDVAAGDHVQLLVSARFEEDIDSPIIGVTVRDRMGMEVTATNTSYEGMKLPPCRKGEVVTVKFHFGVPSLRTGSYTISPAVASGNIWEHTVEDWIDNAFVFSIRDTGLVYGFMKWSFGTGFRVFPD